MLSTFCASGHPRIVHTEPECPLCVALGLFNAAGPVATATQPESVAVALDRGAAIARGDLRFSHQGKCGTCGLVFWAPKIGLCPSCGSPSVATVMSQELDYVRMKRSQYKVHSRPRGFIVGAKFAFPMPVPGGKYRQMVMPVVARVVRVIVAMPDDPTHWAFRYANTERMAIEVRVKSHGLDTVFYLDNADGKTPWLMTLGVQQQPIGMRQLPVKEVLDDTSIAPFYQFNTSSTKRAQCQTKTAS